jgi:RNA 3'-terminal phosphate cyclase (ATP)
MASLIELDGSQGEGGGQILRTALSLSLVTGRPFRIQHVRAGRERPGLLRQHLAAIRAAASVGRADVTGDAIGSSEVAFAPKALVGGEHRAAVGGAGSATLVFQTILPALLLAKEPSSVILEGGTHNPSAPPYDFLERSFLPVLRRIGARVETRLERRGYYPAGGGRFTARIEPRAEPVPLDLSARGEIRARRARVLLANLDPHIASREESRLRKLLPADLWTFDRENESDGRGPGNAILLEVESERSSEIFTGFGRYSASAERVAEEAVEEMREWLAADVPVGSHLADQLLLPLALFAGGTFRTLRPTRHAKTNADVIARFLPDACPTFVDDGATTLVTVAATARR